MPNLSGGEAVLETLKAAGVDKVFGIISVHNIPIYDAIARLGGIEPICVRHEQGAIYMADGYARASGRIGVAISSTGPGAANAVGALFEAQNASSPVLHITGQVDSAYLGKGKGYLHEAKDQPAMLRAVSRHHDLLDSTAAIPGAIARAIEAVTTGRPGPASLEIPIDLQYARAEVNLPVFEGFPRRGPGQDGVRRAAEMLAAAEQPVIWAGGGAVSANAAAEVRALAERLGAPVVTTVNGRGALPEDHPLSFGTLLADPGVREAVQGADVLLAVGTRFQGGATNNWQLRLPEKLIHVDVDAAEIGRSYPAALAINADARLALQALLRALPADHRRDAYVAECRRIRDAAWETARSRLPEAWLRLMDDLRAALPRDATVVRDATIPVYIRGNRLFPIYEPRTSIYTTSGAIGPGLPLAIGAKLGRPDRPCVALCGDGGFMLNLSELATAVQHEVAVKVLLFNDGGYGVLRGIQDFQFEGRHVAVDLATPDFPRVCEGFGVWARRVDSPAAFRPALEAALAVQGPALLDIDTAAFGPLQIGQGAAAATRPRA
jgi:acetolactate synthase-1/2/3 large subunit